MFKVPVIAGLVFITNFYLGRVPLALIGLGLKLKAAAVASVMLR